MRDLLCGSVVAKWLICAYVHVHMRTCFWSILLKKKNCIHYICVSPCRMSHQILLRRSYLACWMNVSWRRAGARTLRCMTQHHKTLTELIHLEPCYHNICQKIYHSSHLHVTIWFLVRERNNGCKHFSKSLNLNLFLFKVATFEDDTLSLSQFVFKFNYMQLFCFVLICFCLCSWLHIRLQSSRAPFV